MEKDNLTVELEAYSAASGLGIPTICLRALNNSRFYERYCRNSAKMRRDTDKLRAFMSENPPQTEGV